MQSSLSENALATALPPTPPALALANSLCSRAAACTLTPLRRQACALSPVPALLPGAPSIP